MHLIYSALRHPKETTGEHHPKDNSEMQLRYHAYIEACRKHQEYITEIQRHFPNWMPSFKSESPGSERPKDSL
ncbi:MAG TPA: hypothetical protein VG367_17120 [Mucilaginibacter sp.]|nr:hypothetical protein [Mucilaginibacter sp.]